MNTYKTQLKNQFTHYRTWQERYKALLLLANQADHYPESLKDEAHLVKGCENQIWIASIKETQLLYFIGKSESKMMQGLLKLILDYVNEMNQNNDLNLDEIIPFLKELNLWNDFSISKQMGIRAMIEKMDAI